MQCPVCSAPNQLKQFCSNCGQRIRGPSVPTQATTPPAVTRATHARKQGATTYLKLQTSEQAVLHAASRLFSAYIASGQVDESSEAELLKRAVARAIQLAQLTERHVQSDDEDW